MTSFWCRAAKQCAQFVPSVARLGPLNEERGLSFAPGLGLVRLFPPSLLLTWVSIPPGTAGVWVRDTASFPSVHHRSIFGAQTDADLECPIQPVHAVGRGSAAI